MSTSNQTLKVNPAYWHNKRYSKDEIKRIQSALNKQALGKQIAVDGIFGKETLAAIKNFQTQHSDILKVDGLVGDQTLSALGITNIADASLPQTRPGQNQSRGTDKKPKGMSDADYEYQKNYYNSPEMISYLMNATNANTDPGYTNHYYNALNFVSPEIASKLRALNNEGDAYDREVAENRDQSFKRAVGIKEFKNAIASGHIKTAEDMDKWMVDHKLSKEEMQELMNDPSSSEAMLRAGVIADNGRVNSQKSQAKRFQQDVTNAMNEAGVNYALPFMLGVGNVATAGSAAILPMLGSIVGGKTVDKGINLATDGQYRDWVDWSSDKFNIAPENRWVMGALHPGAITGAALGGASFKMTAPGTRVDRVMTSPEIKGHYNKQNIIGYKEVQPYPRTGYKKVTLANSRKQIPNEPFYQNAYIVQNKIPYTQQVAGYKKALYEWVPKVPAQYENVVVNTPGHLQVSTQPYGFMPMMHYEAPNRSIVIQDVPEYDRGNTYGPHIGINRVKSNKEGGLINKVQYFKKGNTMQQQDIKQKVKDLVQLAMQQGQEAEQANQLIQSIFEKAKQGDPQSVQLAQLIQAELQQVQGQGQTAYAKFGSKLDYIRSLKYAKGGKTCPACEAKQQMIAQQACGGKAKKAKKRYFGGWL